AGIGAAARAAKRTVPALPGSGRFLKASYTRRRTPAISSTTPPATAPIAINAAILNAVGRRGTGSTLSIGDVSVTEGNGGTTNAVFTVSLSPASSNTVTVHYASAD